MRRRLLLAAAVVVAMLATAATAQAVPVWRGIIEGSYGTPWDHGARVRMLRWMPRHDFNAYVHAPKDDLYQRALWRQPWPDQDLSEYLGEIALARALHVKWIPNLSPAAPLIPSPLPPGVQPDDPICFSCPGDLQLVVDKLKPFLDAGVGVVMVSFDDVREELTHPEDETIYGNGPGAFGAASASFLNGLYDALQQAAPGVELLSVPADYAGTRDTPYLQALRANLRPGVQLMWTGPRSRSTKWTAEDAQTYAALIGRTPIVWDNWTNNDAFGGGDPVGSARVFLGPYTRPPSVLKAVGGFFFNPASEADLNKLPLATAGDWLRHPWGYNPRLSWLRAVTSLAPPGSGLVQPLRAWAESSYSTKLNPLEGPTFSRLASQFLGAFDSGGYWLRVLTQLRSELWLVADARHALGRLPDRAFYVQAKPYLDSAWQAAQEGVVAATLLEAERPALRATRSARGGFRVTVAPASAGRAATLRSLLARWKQVAQSSDRLVYGWRPLDGNAIPPYGRPNVMDGFVEQVEQRDAAWQAAAADPGTLGALQITVDGGPGPIPAGGTFGLSGADCGDLIAARDGAGGQTSLRLPRC